MPVRQHVSGLPIALDYAAGRIVAASHDRSEFVQTTIASPFVAWAVFPMVEVINRLRRGTKIAGGDLDACKHPSRPTRWSRPACRSDLNERAIVDDPLERRQRAFDGRPPKKIETVPSALRLLG